MRRECQCEHSARNIYYEDPTGLFQDHPNMSYNVQNALMLLAEGAGKGGTGIFDAGMQEKKEQEEYLYAEIFNCYGNKEDPSDINGTDENDNYANWAKGEYSHAEGFQTGIGQKTAKGSHAEGYGTTVIDGKGAHVEGYFTKAQGDGAHASGCFNDYKDENDEPYLSTIGNGESDNNRSNAVAVKRNGDVKISGQYTDITNEILIPVVPINILDPTFIETYTDVAGFEASEDYKSNIFYAYYSQEPPVEPEPDDEEPEDPPL